MLLRILDKETGVIARDCIRVIYCILHENIVTMKLFSQCISSYSSLILSSTLHKQDCSEYSLSPSFG